MATDELAAPGLIQARGVSLTYRGRSAVEALAGIDLAVREGEFLTIIGPSGCGKSSLLSILAGLVPPTQGTVEVGGTPVTGPMPDRVGFVFQEYTLFPWRTALRNIEFGLELRHLGRGERRHRALQQLDLVGLAGFRDSYPHELSGGMQQRVAIARALALEPELLLMDEPFGALDEQTRMGLGEQLSEIVTATGRTVVFITHSLAEAVFLSDRVVVMSRCPGRIKAVIEVPEPQPRDSGFLVSHTFADLHRRLQLDLREETTA